MNTASNPGSRILGQALSFRRLLTVQPPCRALRALFSCKAAVLRLFHFLPLWTGMKFKITACSLSRCPYLEMAFEILLFYRYASLFPWSGPARGRGLAGVLWLGPLSSELERLWGEPGASAGRLLTLASSRWLSECLQLQLLEMDFGDPWEPI